MKEGINSFNIILPNGQKGRNLLSNRPEDWEQGTLSSDGKKIANNTQIRTKNALYLKPSTTYTLSSSGWYFALNRLTSDGVSKGDIAWRTKPFTFTTAENEGYCYIKATPGGTAEITPSAVGTDCKIMFEEGDTAHEWDDGTTRGIIQTIVTSDARLTQELMTSDQIELSWTDSEWQVIPAGSYIMYYGEKYTLLEPYQPEQRDEVYYDYKPKFVAEQFTWEKYPFFLYTPQTATDGTEYVLREPSWTLTDEPKNFMNLIVEAIKRETGETWTAETVKDGYEQGSATLTFEDTDILSALNSIADAFGSEWFVDKATKTIWLKTALVTFEGENPYYPLRVGQNVAMPSISNNKEDKYYNRYVVFGSSRNIVQDAQLASSNTIVNRRLTLDPTKYPEGYIDAEQNPTHVYTKILYFEDIYPHADLKVANVLRHTKNKDESNKTVDEYSVYYFRLIDGNTGTDLAFDPTTYDKEKNPSGNLISGLTLSINFKTGSLRGREFEMEYLTAPRNCQNVDKSRFTVPKGYYCVKFIEENGFVIPSEGIRPKDGDEVILFNCRMPDSYVTTAQKELEAAALKEIANYEQDTASYTVDSYADAFRMAAVDLTIGSAVSLDRTLRGTLLSRVTKIERSIDLPYVQTITVGNQRIKGAISTLKEQVAMQEASLDEVTKVAHSVQRGQQNLPRQFADIMETTDALVDAKLDGYDEKITPIAVQTMQTVVGDESLQFRFVENFEKLEAYWENPTENPLKEVYLDAVWDKDAQSWSIMTAYLQHMTYGVGAMTGQSGAAKARRQWVIGKYDSGALTETDKRYYLYAVVDIYDNENENYGEGHFELSEEAHELHEEDGYLWLLVGILSAETDGNRSFARMYGYTEILPGRITTDKIVSDDGETYFDLKSGEIGGNIKFNAGNKTEIENIVNTAVEGADIDGKIEDAVSHVKKGRRNLLRGTRKLTLGVGTWATATFRNSGNGTTEQVSIADSPIEDINTAMQLRADSSIRQGIVQDVYSLEAGTYTMSVWVRGTKGQIVRVQPWWMGDDDWAYEDIVLDTSDWVRLSYTATRTNMNTVSIGYIYLQRSVSGGETLDVLGLKLEKGDTATDWTEAPEDIDYLRESLQVAAQDTTLVSGGLVLSKFMGVRGDDGKTVTAGMNGNANEDLPMIFAGRDSSHTKGTFQVYKNGHVETSDIKIVGRKSSSQYMDIENGTLSLVNGSKKSIISSNTMGAIGTEATQAATSATLRAVEIRDDHEIKYTIRSCPYYDGDRLVYKKGATSFSYDNYTDTILDYTASVDVIVSSVTPSNGVLTFDLNGAYGNLWDITTAELLMSFQAQVLVSVDGSVSEYFSSSFQGLAKDVYKFTVNIPTSLTIFKGQVLKIIVKVNSVNFTIRGSDEECIMSESDLNYNKYATLYASKIQYKVQSDGFKNKYMANGYLMQDSTVKYFGVATDQTNIMEARNGDYGMCLSKNGLLAGSWKSSQWTRMNPLVLICEVAYSNDKYKTSVKFNPLKLTVGLDGTRNSTGDVTIPVNVGHVDYSVSANSISGTTPFQIGIYARYISGIRFVIADDSSRNDGNFIFHIFDYRSY